MSDKKKPIEKVTLNQMYAMHEWELMGVEKDKETFNREVSQDREKLQAFAQLDGLIDMFLGTKKEA